jgi:putative transposase
LAEEHREILIPTRGTRKSGGILRCSNAVKYAWIKAQQNQHTFNVNAMCEMLGVMRSGYYAWKNNPQSARDKEDIRLGELIKKSFAEGRNTYGRKRIQDDLKDWGEKVSKRRIGKLMDKLGLWCKTRKKFKATTNSRHNEQISPNLLNRKFKVGKPNTVWVGDTSAPCGYHVYLDL